MHKEGVAGRGRWKLKADLAEAKIRLAQRREEVAKTPRRLGSMASLRETGLTSLAVAEKEVKARLPIHLETFGSNWLMRQSKF